AVRRAPCAQQDAPWCGGPRSGFRRDGAIPYNGGSSSGPTKGTSGSSSIPNRSCTRRRAAALAAGRAAEAAPPPSALEVPWRGGGRGDGGGGRVALEAARLDQSAGAAVAGRVLEDAAEGPLRRRLRRFARAEKLGHPCLHLGCRPRLQP